MVKRISCLLAFGLGAVAQSDGPKVVVNLDGFRYVPIARQARIQGNVVFRVSASGREFVSSANPLLTPAAEDNLKTWTLPPLANGSYHITYHFVLDVDAPPKLQSVPIGNGFSRFFRRLVGAPTTKTVKTFCYSVRDDPAPSYVIVAEDDVKIDVTAGALPMCVQTEVAALSHL
jgi:hypothetical protein